MTDLAPLARDVGPWAVLVLLILTAGWRVLDKLSQTNGPVTRVMAWISERELRALRRQGAEEAERRRLARDAESETVTWLRSHVTSCEERIDEQEAELVWFRREANDLRRRDRHHTAWEREMAVWLAAEMPRIRAGQAPATDPPPAQPLTPLLVLEDDVEDLREP